MPWIDANRKVIGDVDSFRTADHTLIPGGWDKAGYGLIYVERPAEPAGVAVSGWHVDAANQWVWETRDYTTSEAARSRIAALEASITDRRWREAGPDDAGGTPDGRAWLLHISDQIAALRGAL
jgi:hypothetical protein